MKKALILLALFISFAYSYAQDVTKFLGIPIDGYKSAMIQKLKDKGYRYDVNNDCLTGEFNGQDVNIFIVTHNNKVCRIMVGDANYTSETNIKIRFNTLCRQFEKNERYMNASLGQNDYILSESEDISYEMSVNNKRYEASYWQINQKLDSATLYQEMLDYAQLHYGSIEAIDKMSPEERQLVGMAIIANFMEKFSQNSVWFMIDQRFGKYGILLYYDNERNRANGEDL